MVRTVLLWLGGFVSLLIALEVLCHILPVSTSTETGYYTDPLILTYPPRHRWIASTGWDLRNAQSLQANNLGYAAHRDFVKDERAVALIGDSFIEASMLDAPDRPGAQLERLLGSRPVYAMGVQGTSLLDYAERIRFASERFGVRDFVLLIERGDVMQSLCGSGNVNGPCLDPQTLTPRTETLPSAGLAKRLLRHSALAQYLASQLRATPHALVALLSPQTAPKPQKTTADNAKTLPVPNASDKTLLIVDTVAKAFFERIKPHVHGKLILVLDSDRVTMYEGATKPDPVRQRFAQLARTAGAIVVDTQPIFATHISHSKLKLEVGPYDTHMNKIAVNLAMQASAAALGPN